MTRDAKFFLLEKDYQPIIDAVKESIRPDLMILDIAIYKHPNKENEYALLSVNEEVDEIVNKNGGVLLEKNGMIYHFKNGDIFQELVFGSNNLTAFLKI